MINNVNNSNNTTHNHIPDTSPSAPTNNRWWENYLVRYLVPSIVGMFILIILNRITDDSIKNLLFSFYANKSENKLSNTILIIWFLLGTGFCYIASYPILALHVLARFSYDTTNNQDTCLNKMTIKIVIPILGSLMLFMLNNIFIISYTIKTISMIEVIKIIMPVVIIVIFMYLLLISYVSNAISYISTAVAAALGAVALVAGLACVIAGYSGLAGLAVGLTGLAVGLTGLTGLTGLAGLAIVAGVTGLAGINILAGMITLIGVATFFGVVGVWITGLGIIIMLINYLLKTPQKEEKTFPENYFNKLKARYSIQDTKSNSNITDSYKHLREHGNTALIIILEVILAICLYAPLKYINLKNHEVESLVILTITVLALISWLTPAAIIYFFGHAIENEHLKDSSLPKNTK